jgi:hypothetical protein
VKSSCEFGIEPSGSTAGGIFRVVLSSMEVVS